MPLPPIKFDEEGDPIRQDDYPLLKVTVYAGGPMHIDAGDGKTACGLRWTYLCDFANNYCGHCQHILAKAVQAAKAKAAAGASAAPEISTPRLARRARGSRGARGTEEFKIRVKGQRGTIKRLVDNMKRERHGDVWHWTGTASYLLDTIRVQGTSKNPSRPPEVWEEV